MSNPKSSVRSGSESAADAAVRFLSQDGALQGNLFEAPEPSTQPAAALTSESAAASHDLSDDELGADAAARLRLTPMASTPFSPAEAERTLQQHYGLSSLHGLGLPEHPLALQALGGLLRYLHETHPLEDNSRIPLEVPAIVHRGDALVLDAQTRRNLELTATQRDNRLQGSLLWAIDRTLTAMGGRCLRR